MIYLSHILHIIISNLSYFQPFVPDNQTIIQRINGQSHGNLEVLFQTIIHRINGQSLGNLEVLVQITIHIINGQSHGNPEVLVQTPLHRINGQSHGNLEVLVKHLVSLLTLEPMSTQYADFSICYFIFVAGLYNLKRFLKLFFSFD